MIRQYCKAFDLTSNKLGDFSFEELADFEGC